MNPLAPTIAIDLVDYARVLRASVLLQARRGGKGWGVKKAYVLHFSATQRLSGIAELRGSPAA